VRVQAGTFALLDELLALVFEELDLGAGIGNFDLAAGQIHQVFALRHTGLGA
jgi:hypothetical protein